MNFHLKNLGLFILLVGSTIQYGDYLVSRYFVPFVSVCICWTILFLSRLKLDRIDRNYLFIHSLVFVLFSVLSFLGSGETDEVGFDVVKLFLAYSMSLLAYLYVKKGDHKSVHTALLLMLCSSVIFLSLELFGRLTLSPGGLSLLTSNFYLLKINSPYMVDSNAVGLYALFYFIVAMYALKEYKLSNRFITIILALMLLGFILATLSRASIITAFFVCVLFYWKGLPKSVKYLSCFIALLLISYIFNSLILTVVSDGSGSTKINVLASVFSILPTLDVKGVLFGYGINMGNYIYSYEVGKYSHLLITMILGQFGIVGAILYVLFFTYCLFTGSGRALIFMIAAFVVGLSYLHPFLESIFLVNGILLGLNHRKPFKNVY